MPCSSSSSGLSSRAAISSMVEGERGHVRPDLSLSTIALSLSFPRWPNRPAALVTGGTGRVGRVIAARLEPEGYRVFAAGRKDGDLSRADDARALVERAPRSWAGWTSSSTPRATDSPREPVEERDRGRTGTRPSARLRRAASSSPRRRRRTSARSEGLIVLIEDVAAFSRGRRSRRTARPRRPRRC